MNWFLQGVLLFLLALSAVGDVQPVPEVLRFQDLYFREFNLGTRASSPACVLFFYTNTCPVARRYVPRMIALESRYRDKGVRFVAVNVSTGDSTYDVAAFAHEFGLTFPVVKDRDFSVVKALGITRTPEVVVLDKTFSMVYQGRIDDQYRLGGVQAKATRSELADALEAVLVGKPVPTPSAPAEGCVVTLPDLARGGEAGDESAQSILVSRCLPCHVEGASAPFALTTFDNLRARKDRIGRVLEDGHMPPWQHAIGETSTESGAMPVAERDRLLRWIAGPLNCDGALVERSPSLADFDRTFQASRSVDGRGEDSQEWELGPVVDSEMWVAAILVQGLGRAACVYYEMPGGVEKRCYLAGGLLPGKALCWNGDESMRLPAGARLHVSMRGGRATPPTLRLRTLARAPASVLTCDVAQGPVDRTSKLPVVVLQRLEPNSLVRDVAIDFAGFGARASVFLGAGTPSPILTLPALDPRWIQPVPVDTRADQLRMEMTFPGYLGNFETGRGDATPQEVAAESSVSVYIHSVDRR